MGYVCRKANVLRCLTALEAVLRRNGFKLPHGAAVDAAYRVYQGRRRRDEPGVVSHAMRSAACS